MNNPSIPKKILVVTSRFPYPVIGGDRQRIFQICKALSKSYRLSLLSLCESKSELNLAIPNDGVFANVERVYLPRWKSWLNCLVGLVNKRPLQVSYYRSAKLTNKVLAQESQYDAALVHLIRMAEVVIPLEIPKFLEMTDAISLNYDRIKKNKTKLKFDFRSLVYQFEVKRLIVYEKSIVDKFDDTFLVSEIDRQYLFGNNVNALSKVHVSSLGVDLNLFPYNFEENARDIIFIGNMNSLQNLDAATFMASEILPLIRETLPNVQLKLIGRISETNSIELRKYAGVIVTGEVENVANEAMGGAVGVCPVRLGAGAQNKVLEYMALGLPMVTTSLGLEGYHAQPNRDLLVADDSVDFSSAVVQLLLDRNCAKEMAMRARQYVFECHGWDPMLKPMIDAINLKL